MNGDDDTGLMKRDKILSEENVRHTPLRISRSDIESYRDKWHERAWALIYPGKEENPAIDGTLEKVPELHEYTRQLFNQGHIIDFVIADSVLEKTIRSRFGISDEDDDKAVFKETINGVSSWETNELKTTLESTLRKFGATTANCEVKIMSDLSSQDDYSGFYNKLRNNHNLKDRIASYTTTNNGEFSDTQFDIEVSKLAIALTQLGTHAYWLSFDERDNPTLTLLQKEADYLEDILNIRLPEFEVIQEEGYKIITTKETTSDRLLKITAPTVPSATDKDQPDHIYIMQQKNLTELVKYAAEVLKKNGISLDGKEKRILDAGCGDGLLSIITPDLEKTMPVFMGSNIIGVDKNERRYKSARANFKREKKDYKERLGIDLPKSNFYDQDLISIKPGSRYPKEGFSLIVCNQVLHWIENGDRQKAIENLYGLLAPGGVLIMSTAATGTAPELLKSYSQTLEELGEYHETLNPFGYKPELVRKRLDHNGEVVWDPIGSIPKDALKEYVRKGGFQENQLSRSDDEIIIFKGGVHEYTEAVRSYGSEEFLAPLDHLPNKRKNEIWNLITDRFIQLLKWSVEGYRDNEEYHHKQSTNYLVAWKPIVQISK